MGCCERALFGRSCALSLKWGFVFVRFSYGFSGCVRVSVDKYTCADAFIAPAFVLLSRMRVQSEEVAMWSLTLCTNVHEMSLQHAILETQRPSLACDERTHFSYGPPTFLRIAFLVRTTVETFFSHTYAECTI